MKIDSTGLVLNNFSTLPLQREFINLGCDAQFPFFMKKEYQTKNEDIMKNYLN